MVRAACCDEMGLKKGPWTPEEDRILVSYVQNYGHGNWRALPKLAGLSRCGKSCRLRWTNYLRPDVKRGDFSKEEEETIIYLHAMLGNRWSAIAAKLPGRTDNEIKNVWHTHLKKRLNPSQAIKDSKRRKRNCGAMNKELEQCSMDLLKELPELDEILMAGAAQEDAGKRFDLMTVTSNEDDVRFWRNLLAEAGDLECFQ